MQGPERLLFLLDFPAEALSARKNRRLTPYFGIFYL